MTNLVTLLKLYLLSIRCSVVFIQTSVVAQEMETRYIVDEEGYPPMSAIRGYATIGGDSAVYVDNTHNIFLLISDRREKIIGQVGNGSCEHRSVTSFTVGGDTLFVLDSRSGRIVEYSIDRGDCVAEVGTELSRFGQIGRHGDAFYLIKRGSYTSASPSDEPLFYRLNSAGQLQPLNLTIGDLDRTQLFPIPVRLGRRIPQVKEKEGKLYFILPFSHKIWIYDPQTEDFSSFDLVNNPPDISERNFPTDTQGVSQLLSESELEMGFFPLENVIATLSLFELQPIVRIYSYDGNLIGEETDVKHVDFEERGRLYSLQATDSETEIYSIEPIDLRLN